jgi:hypothetical protein
MTAKEHEAYVEEHGKLPMKKSKINVLNKVHDHINERGIWIPYGEFHSHVSVMIDKLNRKNPIYYPPAKKETKPKKPTPPKVSIEEFPENVQLEIKEKLMKQIQYYKAQTRRLPPDKIRSGHIKMVLSGFNSKQWKQYEKKMTKSEALLSLYDELRNQSE